MPKPPKTLIRIQLIDLLKAPLPNVYHVIREGGTVISEGSTDSNGCGVWIRRSIGTTLNIAIKDPKTKTMMSLPPVTVAKPKNGSNGTTVRLQAAYYKQSIRLLERQGNQGNYRRKTHSVKQGETLESIAKQYGTTWQILQQLNKDKISNPDRIQVGWQLKVPPKHSGLRNMGQGSTPPKSTPKPSTAKITTANYQVQAGDTLGSIAQRCGKSIADLQRLNGIYNPNKIKVGQNLKTGLPNYPVSQPKPQTTRPSPSTTEKNGGILDSMADAVNRAGQAIDSGVEALDSAWDALKDAASDLFSSDDKQATPPAKPTSTSTSKPKSTPSKPTKITTTSQRSGNESGTPKEVVEKLKSPIIFPLLEQPVNDPGKPYAGFDWRKKLGEKGASQAVFGVNRSQGGRKHAGRDLYTRVQNADKNAKTGGVVVSIAPGKILAVKNFYNGTDQVTISHVTEDGRKFIVRYGKLDTKSVQQLRNRIGGSISQGEILGVTGILRANKNGSGPPMSFSAVGGKNISMLHFEYFTGKGHSLDRADNLSSKSGVYKRRSDLADPLEILLEGYSATFLKPLPASNSQNKTLEQLIGQLGDIIASGEGSYEAWNAGAPKGKKVKYGKMRDSPGTITGKTINELLYLSEAYKWTDPRRRFATGKYQTTPSTLREAKTKIGLTGNELYNADMQERVFREYLIYKQPLLKNFIKHGKGSVDDAMQGAAQVWVSIGMPKGRKCQDGVISDGTRSFYHSKTNQAVPSSTESVRVILKSIQEYHLAK